MIQPRRSTGIYTSALEHSEREVPFLAIFDYFNIGIRETIGYGTIWSQPDHVLHPNSDAEVYSIL